MSDVTSMAKAGLCINLAIVAVITLAAIGVIWGVGRFFGAWA